MVKSGGVRTVRAIAFFCLIILFAFLLVGCGSNDSADSEFKKVDSGKKVSPEKEGNRYCKRIIECLNENNQEGLKDLFCDVIKNDGATDAEIEEFMAFWDGECTTYSFTSSPTQESVDHGKQTYVCISPTMKVQMDNGKEYTLVLHIEFVNNERPDAIGVLYMIIKNSDDDRVSIGDYLKVYPK